MDSYRCILRVDTFTRTNPADQHHTLEFSVTGKPDDPLALAKTLRELATAIEAQKLPADDQL